MHLAKPKLSESLPSYLEVCAVIILPLLITAEIPNSGITNVNSVFINPSAFAGIFTFTALSRFFPTNQTKTVQRYPCFGPCLPHLQFSPKDTSGLSCVYHLLQVMIKSGSVLVSLGLLVYSFLLNNQITVS